MKPSTLLLTLCLDAVLSGCRGARPPSDSDGFATDPTTSTADPTDSLPLDCPTVDSAAPTGTGTPATGGTGTWVVDTGHTGTSTTIGTGTWTGTGTWPGGSGGSGWPADTGDCQTFAEVAATCYPSWSGGIYYPAGPCPTGVGNCYACCGGRPLVFGAQHRPDTAAGVALSGLARFWAGQAADEAASVVAFERAVRELELLGAPAALIEDHRRAATEEADHATRCLDLASRVAGSPVRLAPWDPGPLPIRRSLVDFAVAVFLEGCLNETLAAGLAEAQARRATDPHAREHLAHIAHDEARHAALSWRTVRWALDSGGDAVRDALLLVVDTLGEPTLDAAPDDTCEPQGWLGPDATNTCRAAVLAQVVRPCTQALLGPGIVR